MSAPGGQAERGLQPLLVLAAGGTGGHVFPAQAVAEEMLEREWRVSFWTDSRGARFARAFPREVEIETHASTTPSRGSWTARAAAPARIAAGVFKAAARIRRRRPAVVVGFGGYPAFPPVAAAWMTGTPRIIHEQNGVLGRANRLLAPRVNLLACGAVETAVPQGIKAAHTGNPVRADVLANAGAPFEIPSSGELRVLAVGGSQGAEAFDSVMPAAAGLLREEIRRRVRLTQQVRSENVETVTKECRTRSIECEVKPFFDDLPRRIAQAHLVVSRSGASSIAELCVVGRPSILIPFPAAANDHQTANATGMVNAGAAVMIRQTDLTPELLGQEIERILCDAGKASEMAEAAKRASKPSAASELADAITGIAECRK